MCDFRQRDGDANMTTENLLSPVKVAEREEKAVTYAKTKNLALKMMEELLKYCWRVLYISNVYEDVATAEQKMYMTE